MTTVVTKPGLYYDMPEHVYHADPVPEGSLSHSRAKLLLNEAGPAEFQATEGANEHKAVFDVGTAFHALLLGVGEDQLVPVDAPDWRTKAARDARNAAYADGLTPLLTKELDEIRAAVAKVPTEARERLTGGHPEVSMFWQHDSGLWLRGRADYYKPNIEIIDVKTMRATDFRDFRNTVWGLRYYMQAAWYRRGIEALTGERLPYFIVAINKSNPALTRVQEISDNYLDLGDAHMDQVIATYLECVETNTWPGYPDDLPPLEPPPWALDDLADATITELENLIGA